MWVFGYGSLMTDGWEEKNGWTRRVLADFVGYRRVFNKASVRNWGTRNNPGPTLNLEKAERGSCRGIAFEFPEDRVEDVLAVLADREGQNFALHRMEIQLLDGTKVLAHIPLYTGENLIKNKSLDEIAAMILKANGTKGSCALYIEDVATVLRNVEIDDPAGRRLAKQSRPGAAIKYLRLGKLRQARRKKARRYHEPMANG